MSQFKIKITGTSTSIKNILKINNIDNNISNLICILNTNKGEEGIYYEKILLFNLKNNIVKIAKYLYDKNDQPMEGISVLMKSDNQYTYVKIESYLTDINSIYEVLFDIQNRIYNDEKKDQNNQHLTKKNKTTTKKIDPKDLILTTLTGAIIIVFLFISAKLMYIILLDITIRYLPFSLLYDYNFRRDYLEKQWESDRKWEAEQKRNEDFRECEKLKKRYNLSSSSHLYFECRR